MTKWQNVLLVILAIVLMPLNWLLETIKWKGILDLECKIPLKTAFFSVFRGTSFGIVTPGRIGEYGGRVLYLPVQYRAYGAFATFISSLGQNLLNVLGGLVAFSFLQADILGDLVNERLFTIVVLFLLVSLTLVYFFINSCVEFFVSLKFAKKFKFQSHLKDFTLIWKEKSKWRLLFISLLRYCVYLSQYLLILLAFDIDIGSSNLILGIMLLFIVQTMLPLTPILQFAVRGGLAISILGYFTEMHETLLIASYAMWVLNLLIPGIIGTISILIHKQRINENEVLV